MQTEWMVCHDANLIKYAHIVPKSLECDELAYLFGVRETVVSAHRRVQWRLPLLKITKNELAKAIENQETVSLFAMS